MGISSAPMVEDEKKEKKEKSMWQQFTDFFSSEEKEDDLPKDKKMPYPLAVLKAAHIREI